MAIDTAVMGLSLLLQWTAAALALRLIWITGAGKAWAMIAVGVLLMGVRRAIVLATLLTGGTYANLDLPAELIAVADSLCLAVGIAAIAPLFRRFHRSEEALRKSAEVLEQQVRERTAALTEEVLAHRKAEEALQEEQRHLRELLEMYERDRKLVAYEIHDGFVQQAAAALMHLQSFGHLPAQDPAAAQKAVDQAVELLGQSMAEARWLIGGLRPTILEDFGLVPALDHLVEESQRRSGVKVEWSHQVQFNRLQPPLETALYRIVQESLANALRHSGSPRARIAMVEQQGRLRIEIEDWGCGFQRERVAPDRYGLQGIRERARLFGGEACIDSVPGRGTRIVVQVPVSGHEEGTPAGVVPTGAA